VRLEVVRALQAFADKRALPLLQKMFSHDPDQRVRDAALTAYRKLATHHGVRYDEAELRAAATATVQADRPFDRLLRDARLAEASDVHVVPESRPAFRIHGDLVDVGDEPLSAEDTERMIGDILPPRFREALKDGMQADFPHVVAGVGRHRVNVFQERRGLSAVVRLIPLEAPSYNELGLPPQVKNVVSMQQGLVIVTGRTGSGKTTTMAALVNLLNEARPVHIITLEDPIEYLHERRRGLVNQREVGRHSVSFPAALRSALREDPDVIVVGEMRDLVTIRLAVEAAETGHLVIATLHTPSAVGAVQRLVEAFPVTEQQQVRLMISDSLRMVVAQSLVRRASGKGRVGAFELLVNTQAVSGLIRENKFNQIAAVMQTGKAEGMKTMDASLLELLQAREITAEDAYARALNKDAFRQHVTQQTPRPG
jgi:twitching motility protein PilT